VSYTSIERLADLLDIAKASSAGLPGSLSTIVDPHMLRETMRDLDRLRCELRSHLADIDRRAHDIEELMEALTPPTDHAGSTRLPAFLAS
jgi:hypothetical protein